MKRAVLMSAASAFCLLWATGCSTVGKPDAKQPVASAAVVTPPDENPNASSDIATLAKNMPSTMEGEIKRARLLREKGDYPEAEHSLAQLMLVAPDDGIVVGEYGKVLEQEGRSTEALGFLTRAVELQPRDWALYSALGIAYDQLDKRENARTAYERALALKPGEASVLNNYAVSRMLAGDYAGAQRMLAQASAHGATDPKIAMNAAKLASISPLPPAPVALQAPPQPKPVPPPAIKVAVLPSATAQAAAVKPVATQAPKPMTVAPGAASHAPIVVGSLKAPQPTVVMQRVPFDPLATKSASVHSAGALGVIVSPHPVATHAPLAIVAARSLGPNVVMQRVPYDPLAGPVAAHKPVHKPVVAAAAKPVDTTPSLRTAADTGN
jgi:Flp pilus assembly protein TadD